MSYYYPTDTDVHNFDDVRTYLVFKKKGVVLINKMNTEQVVQLEGVKGGEASCVEVDVTVEEPGFVPPISKSISASGTITLGPFSVAVVTEVDFV